jgi:hypothetical protein
MGQEASYKAHNPFTVASSPKDILLIKLSKSYWREYESSDNIYSDKVQLADRRSSIRQRRRSEHLRSVFHGDGQWGVPGWA